MAREIPAIRIFPMSTAIPGFLGRSIEWVQREVFLGDLPANGGRWRYQKSGLNADHGTLVLFQFRARIIASAIFLRDEKSEKLTGRHAGALYFDPRSLRTFDPLDVAAMRSVWPRFRAFGHVKQHLNPAMYASLRRRLTNVRCAPARNFPMAKTQ